MKQIIYPWLLAARPKTLLASVAPVLLGCALAFQLGSLQLLPAFFCLLFALMTQIGCNYSNDYYDFVNGIDNEKRIGFKRAVASGLIEPKHMQIASFVVLLVAFCLGTVLIFYGGWWMLAVGLLSILCALAYTSGPYPLAYYGFGDLFVFIFFGIVAVVFTVFVQTGYVTLECFLVAVGCGFLASNIRLVNDTRDRETDAHAGKRTLAVRLGKKYCLYQYALSLFIAFCIPVLLVLKGYGFGCLSVLLLIPFAMNMYKKLAHAGSGAQYNQLLFKSSKFLLIYALLLSLGILFSS